MDRTQWAAAAFATIACVTTAQAANEIAYRDIERRLPKPEQGLRSRTFLVTTNDGKIHKGRELKVESEFLRVIHPDNSAEDLPKDQIKKIKVVRRGHHYLLVGIFATGPVALGFFLCEDVPRPASWACKAVTTAYTSPIWAFGAVSAPFLLGADAVTLLTPPKVYRIGP